ncbi:MAG: ABC transporter permease [Acidobacteria bacterium]|nr:ABC transporter permease [Acidobacteriota bacterium]
MRLPRVVRHRLRSLFGGEAADRELQRELAFHLEQLTRENIASGLEAREARLAARRALGSLALLEEQCRDQRRVRWWTDLRADARYAWRQLTKSPAFTGLALLTLALGVGAGIAVYTLGEALLLRFLPGREPERLVLIRSVHVRRGESGAGQEDFRDWQASNRVFERMVYTEFSQMSLTGQGEAERITGEAVSAGFFELLGVEPFLGRRFTPEEERPGGERAIMLSHGLWVRKFGARPDIPGVVVALDGRPYRIAGVMPKDFRFNVGHLAEYWTPIAYVNHGRAQHQYYAFARLKPGATVAAAQAEMSRIARRLAEAYPDTHAGWDVRVQSLRGKMLAEFGPALAVFSAAVLIVLLVACGNVASLLLARGIGRAKEVGIRLALGAGRLRIARLLLTESLLLSFLGTAAGLALAAWLVQLAIAVAPAWMGLGAAVSVSPPLVGFTILIAICTGLGTGAWPAIRASRGDLQHALKESGASLVAGRGAGRTLNALVVAEIALSVVLLTFAGLLVKSFARLLRTDLGFRTDRLLTFRMTLPRSGYPNGPDQVRFCEKLLADLAALPGVVSAAAADAIPLGGAYSSVDVEIEGRANLGDWADRSAGNRNVTPDYFRTLGVPLHAGRGFSASDREDGEPVAIVNQAFVRRFLGGENALGKRLRLGSGRWQRIVGVTGDLRFGGPAREVRPETFTPFAQDPWVQFVALRTATPVEPFIAAARAVVRALDPDLPITQVRTMEEALAADTALPRHMTILVTCFAALALGMATLGLGGVMAYSVSRKKREIGLRMALGARGADISAAVARHAAKLALCGLAIGMPTALAAARLAGSLLYGVRPGDPAVAVLAPLALAAVALPACILPARRAARVDPMTALRQE